MGRPRQHDERTRESILVAAERLVAEGGFDAVGVRPAADRAGTSTRAVYALFGSKEGLIQALAQRTFELLGESVSAVPLTSDPGEDLVQGALKGFRKFAIAHPDLYRLFFTFSTRRSAFGASAESAASAALDQLINRVKRAHAAGMLGGYTVPEVVVMWDVACSGLAIREICGRITPPQADRIWNDGLRALLAGFSARPDKET